MVCACLIGNESGRMAVYTTFLGHGYPQGCLATSVHEEVAAQRVLTLQGKNVCFPNCREHQVNRDSTKTKKLKLHSKVAACQGAP